MPSRWLRGYHRQRVRRAVSAGRSPTSIPARKARRKRTRRSARPTSTCSPTQLSGMERDAERLYELIWRQFVACQMPPAEYLSTIGQRRRPAISSCAPAAASSSSTASPACCRRRASRARTTCCRTCSRAKRSTLLQLDPSQHFTKPPARYREASLVKELEKRGIGRPSTYAAIISTIQDRGYVTRARTAASTPRRWAISSPTGWSRASPI